MSHTDAIGYLSDLSKDVNQQWFEMLCDLGIDDISVLTDSDISILFALFFGRASYLKSNRIAKGSTNTASSTSTDFLEKISEFSNFKLIGDALSLDFTKRITLIFGVNGSGKSSICEALRILANSDTPLRPIQNVRNAVNKATGFKFKFRSDSSVIDWSTASGYGVRQSTVKHFDSVVAARNVKVALDPSRVIEITPFKLNSFENVTALTNQFRQKLQERQRNISEKLSENLKSIREDFNEFSGQSLAAITEKNLDILELIIDKAEKFSASSELAGKRSLLVDMEKAASDEGLKLLKSELRELTLLLDCVVGLVDKASQLEKIDPANKLKLIEVKKEAQAVLARDLVPSGKDLDAVIALANAASSLCKLDESSGHSCPLCWQDLGDAEVSLFKNYHDLISDELEKEINGIKAEVDIASKLSKEIAEIIVTDWEKYESVSAEYLTKAVELGKLIVDGCSLNEGVKPSASDALIAATAFATDVKGQIDAKKLAVDAGTVGRDELLGKITLARKEIEPIAYEEVTYKILPKLKETQNLGKRLTCLMAELSKFSTLLGRITNAAKKAHDALVVADFETRLNNEYQRLTERTMAEFGVALVRRGSDSSVTILPQIGGKEIEGVLSEGEQRIHALALFFAELETCSQSIIAFDDPVTSFDYNYIANYCSRMSEYAKDHSTSQIIVLTHNWEFFVQLQTSLKKANLSGDFAVQVLENCVSLNEYSEDVTVLKNEIENILKISTEPSRQQKEILAGNMRILLEAIINTHVFAKQRHQYKQKTQQVSNFDEYTKIVPLLESEAAVLKNLYGLLSMPEHHDPRNAYINTDKAMFQSRFNQLIAIEAAIISRKN